MGKAKVIVDYSSNRYSDLELKNKGDNIVICLTDNPKFASMAPSVTLIKAQLVDYGNWLALMPQGNRQVTIDKNNSRKLLENMLSTAALQVQEISGGDESIIVSSGFDVKRKPMPVGLLDRPENVQANPGPTRGSMEISWDVVDNAYLYEVEYTEAPSTPESKWLRTSTTKHRIVIDGLIRGKAYAYKVAGAGSDPGRVWRDEIISYVM